MGYASGAGMNENKAGPIETAFWLLFGTLVAIVVYLMGKEPE